VQNAEWKTKSALTVAFDSAFIIHHSAFCIHFAPDNPSRRTHFEGLSPAAGGSAAAVRHRLEKLKIRRRIGR
jgi:hypothetical protein